MTSGPDAAVKPTPSPWHVLLIQLWWPASNKLLVTVSTGNFRDPCGHAFHSKSRLGGLGDLRSTRPFNFLVGIPLDVCTAKHVSGLTNPHLFWAAATSNFCMSFWQLSSTLRKKAAATSFPGS